MAKITAASYIEGISGKVCRHSQDEFRTNSSSGTIVLSKKCNPYQGEATEKQKSQQTIFGAMAKVRNSWLATNRPTDDNADGTELYQEALSLKKTLHVASVTAVLAKYQSKTSPYAIVLPSESAATGGSSSDSSSTPSGSNENSGGSGGNGGEENQDGNLD